MSPQKLFTYCLIFLGITLLFSFNSVYSKTNKLIDDKKLKLKTDNITLIKDAKVEVEIQEVSDFDKNNLNIECKDFCTFTIANTTITFSLNPQYFNIKDESKTVKLTYKKDAKEFTNQISVKVPARINVSEKDEDKIENIVEGEEITMPTNYNYKIIDTDENKTQVKFKTDNFIEQKDGKFKAKKSGNSKVIVLSDTDKPTQIAEFIVNIKPAIKSISRPLSSETILTELTDSPFNIVVKGTDDKILTDYSRIVCKSDNEGYLNINSDSKSFNFAAKSAAGSEKSANIECKIKEKKGMDNETQLNFSVKITPKFGHLKIETLVSNTLLTNGSLPFNVRLFNELGSPTSGAFVYELENKNDSQWVSLGNMGERLVVNWVDLPLLDENNKPKEKRPKFVKINIKATVLGSSKLVTDQITIHLTTVTRFDALKVKLNIMDERTVSDLYGYVTNEEYYVLMVRLFNDLKGNETNKSQGESILAYSSSIEIAVGLEKQYDKSDKLGELGVISKDKMDELRKSRNEKVFTDYSDNLKKLDEVYKKLLDEFNKQLQATLEKDRQALELELLAKNDKNKTKEAQTLRAEASTALELTTVLADQLNNLYQLNTLATPKTPMPNAPINDGRWYPANRTDLIQAKMEESDILSANDEDFDNQNSKSDGEPTCVNTITYRPFTFEMMVNTVDRRQERSPKSWLFKVLNFVSLGATTVSAIAVPGKGSDFPVGLEKFGNFFVPGLEKVIPSFKEQYRQNIVSQAMKPIEEIPFGSDITRVIFIPKKSIKGLIAGHKARISQICPFYFKIKVAVVSKGGEVTLGNQ